MEIKLVACDSCPEPTPGQVPQPAERREFSFDGKRYRVDLCAQHMQEFARVWDAMAQLAASGTQIAARVRTRKQQVPAQATAPAEEPAPAPAPSPLHGPKLSERIRAWAIDNGIEVGDRGRISEDVRRAYHEAHPPQPTPLRVNQG